MTRSTSNHMVTGNSRDRARRRARLVERFGWPEIGIVNCYRCDVPLLQNEDPEAPGQSVTVDRIIPGALGGTYADDNIRPACGPCNQSTGGELGAALVRKISQGRGGIDQGTLTLYPVQDHHRPPKDKS